MTCTVGGFGGGGASLVDGTEAVAGAIDAEAVAGGVRAAAFDGAAGFPGRAMANFLPVLSTQRRRG